ncbi:hypothetical protein [Nostoc sp.]
MAITEILLLIANPQSSNYYVYFLIYENAIAPFYQRDRAFFEYLTFT